MNKNEKADLQEKVELDLRIKNLEQKLLEQGYALRNSKHNEQCLISKLEGYRHAMKDTLTLLVDTIKEQ